MRLIDIDLAAVPQCLNDLRENGGSYDDLQGECRQQVTSALSTMQQGYCAYCERKFTSKVFIEHYIPQSTDQARALEFGNFLGVCSGKEYEDKMVGTYIPHCNVSKGADSLKINPQIKQHIDGIFYGNDASIRSGNQGHDDDLNNILNLNASFLKQLRNEGYNNNLDNLIIVASKLGLSAKESFSKGERIARSGVTEFSGYLAFRYKKLLENSAK